MEHHSLVYTPNYHTIANENHSYSLHSVTIGCEDPTVKPQFKGPIILDPIVKQNLTTGQEL